VSALVRGLTDFALPTHLLAIVALGLLAGQHAARFPRLALIELVAGLFAGSLAIALGIGENKAAVMLLAFAALSAAGVVAARPLPVWVAGLAAFAIGTALPLNAPPQEIAIANAIAAQAGFAIAALATFAVVAVIALSAIRPWQRIGLRIVGSWIAASAILVLALRLAR
jgi:urease accessory protein